MNYIIRSIFLLLIIQITFAFDQKKLPKNAFIVAKDGSGKYKTVKYFLFYFISQKKKNK